MAAIKYDPSRIIERVNEVHKSHKNYWLSCSAKSKSENLAILDNQIEELSRVHPILMTRSSIIAGYGNPQAKVIFFLRSPSMSEAEQGVPYSDKSSMVIVDTACHRLGRDNCYFAYIYPFFAKVPEEKTDGDNNNDDSNNNYTTKYQSESTSFWGDNAHRGKPFQKYVDMKFSDSDNEMFLYYTIRRIRILHPRYVVGFGTGPAKLLLANFKLNNLRHVYGAFKELLIQHRDSYSMAIDKDRKYSVYICPHPYFLDFRLSNDQKKQSEYYFLIDYWNLCFANLNKGLLPFKNPNEGGNSNGGSVHVENMFTILKTGAETVYNAQLLKKKKAAKPAPKKEIKLSKNQKTLGNFSSKIQDTETIFKDYDAKLQLEKESGPVALASSKRKRKSPKSSQLKGDSDLKTITIKTSFDSDSDFEGNNEKADGEISESDNSNKVAKTIQNENPEGHDTGSEEDQMPELTSE